MLYNDSPSNFKKTHTIAVNYDIILVLQLKSHYSLHYTSAEYYVVLHSKSSTVARMQDTATGTEEEDYL